MQLAGTDTQYAPLRHALEFLAGQEKSITAAHPVPAYAGVERCAFSKAQLQEMLQEYRMVVAALEWVLGKRTDEELCDIPID